MRMLVVAVAALLAACSQPGAGPAEWFTESSAPVEAAADAAAGFADQERSEASGEQQSQNAAPGFFMAYSYGLGLELPGQRLAAVMDAHTAACTAAGPAVCQVISATREGDPDEFLSGHFSLRAQPEWLARFMTQAEVSADEAGGEVRSRATNAEDVTRQMVDTEAQLNALRTLRDRLQEILRSRPGRVADLLEVERELARVQGELNATTSTLAVLRQRVDMSELTINYMMADRAVTLRTFEPVTTAASGFLHTVAWGIGGIITFVATVLPWALFLTGAWWVARRFGVGRGWRWPWARRAGQAPSPAGEGAPDEA